MNLHYQLSLGFGFGFAKKDIERRAELKIMTWTLKTSTGLPKSAEISVANLEELVNVVSTETVVSPVGGYDGEWVAPKQHREIADGETDQQMVVWLAPEFWVSKDDGENGDVAADCTTGCRGNNTAEWLDMYFTAHIVPGYNFNFYEAL